MASNYDLLANIFSQSQQAPGSGVMLPQQPMMPKKKEQDILDSILSIPGLQQTPGSGVLLPPQKPNQPSQADMDVMNYLTAIPGLPTTNVNSPIMTPELQQEYGKLAASQTPPPQPAPMPMAPPMQKKQSANAAQPILDMVNPQGNNSVSDMLSEYLKRSTEGLDNQRSGIKSLEDQLNELKGQGSNPFMQALLGLSDTVAGTNYVQNYAQREEAKKQQALALAEKIQGARNNVTDKELDLLKTQWQNGTAEQKQKIEQELRNKEIAQQKYNTDSIAGTARFKEEQENKRAQLKTEKPPEIKDAQAQAAGFGKRMQLAEQTFADLTKKGYNRASITESAKAWLPGAAQSEDLKRQDQAERNFVNAVLRRESGAAISNSEFESAKQQYFPRPGDTDAVLAQKAANRQQAMESMKVAAGPAWAATPLVSASPINDPGFEAWKKSKGL